MKKAMFILMMFLSVATLLIAQEDISLDKDDNKLLLSYRGNYELGYVTNFVLNEGGGFSHDLDVISVTYLGRQIGPRVSLEVANH